MPNCSVGLSECETKFISKHFDMGYVKMHGFHGNPLNDFRDLGWGRGVGLQIQSYLGFYLSHSFISGVKLKLRHVSFFLWSEV